MPIRPSSPSDAPRGTVLRNVGSLYAIRVAMYVFPLVSLPYVVRILGASGYGVVAFAQGLAAYFNLFTDYGFTLSTTRQVSGRRDDREGLRRPASAAPGAKLLLVGAGFVLLLALARWVPAVHAHRATVFAVYGQVLGNALFPGFLFQGMERMAASSLLMVVSMALTTGSVFFVVREAGDYFALGLLWGVSGILTGLLGLVLAVRLFGIRLRVPPLADVRAALRDGALLSLSAGSTTLYASGNTFLLGLMAPSQVVGHYAVAEKLARAAESSVTPILQAVYPRVAFLAATSRERALDAVRRLLPVTAGLGLALSLALAVTAGPVVRILLGSGFEESIPLVLQLAPLPFLATVNSTLILQLMVPFGRDRALMIALLCGGLANVATAVLLAPVWQARGMAVAVVLAETIVLAGLVLSLKRAGLNPFARPPLAA